MRAAIRAARLKDHLCVIGNRSSLAAAVPALSFAAFLLAFAGAQRATAPTLLVLLRLFHRFLSLSLDFLPTALGACRNPARPTYRETADRSAY
ncbi:membrane protein [Burkholderia phage BcepF1]|uniref:Membrane protein n=1 Tax=Burkholderia phage BcepF1 TaxID=2886897 RepID=A1Z030_9CAUD|nr:membrane protein [Burkholderia phage BcepF1]ABL96857.1 membrane protein [Burkholderia phage BcepF1]